MSDTQNLSNSRRIALRGLLAASAMILSWVEAQISAFFAVPGMKLGLTNLVVVAALYYLSWQDALALNIVRIVLVGFTFGNLFSMAYSMAGGLLSFLVMLLLKKSGRFSPPVVSTAGGVFHNVGQILVAIAALESRYVLYCLPFLWVSGIASGFVIGILCAEVLKRLPRSL